MADVENIIEYYVNLLIIQYNNKPKARATIEAVVREILSSGILFDIRDGYSVETAVGVQLDVIGKYVGIDRFYKGQILEGYFGFIVYSEVDSPPATRIGFANYTDFETKEGSFLKYSNIISQDLALNDDDYRFLIKLKIIQNASNHSHKSIDDSMFEFFGDNVYADSTGDMTMIYFVPDSLSTVIEVALQKEVLPRPMGVGIQYIIKKDDPLFGFATYSYTPTKNTGFSLYADYDTKEGETLTYNRLTN